MIKEGIKVENETIIANLTLDAIENLDKPEIKILETTQNVGLLKNIDANKLKNVDNAKNLARKIAYNTPKKYIIDNGILSDDFNLSKQLNKTLTGKDGVAITQDHLNKIHTLSSKESELLPITVLFLLLVSI